MENNVVRLSGILYCFQILIFCEVIFKAHLMLCLLSQHTCVCDSLSRPLLCHLFEEVTSLNVHVAPLINDNSFCFNHFINPWALISCVCDISAHAQNFHSKPVSPIWNDF